MKLPFKKAIPLCMAFCLAVTSVNYTVRAEEPIQNTNIEEKQNNSDNQNLDNSDNQNLDNSDNINQIPENNQTNDITDNNSNNDLNNDTNNDGTNTDNNDDLNNNLNDDTNNDLNGENGENGENNNEEDDEELQVDTVYVGSPSPNDPLNNTEQSNVIIESVEDWDNFIARNDDFWKNGTYVGHAENISITINADISSITQDIIIRPSGEIEEEYKKTKDTTVNDTKTYYINIGDETTPVWTVVDTPIDTDLATYYEKIEHNIYNDNVNLTINGTGTISDNLKVVNDYGSFTISSLTVESSVLDINSINNITIDTITFNNSNLYVNSNSTNPVYNITGSKFIGSSGVYNATTFNNPSYTSASMTPKFTINFTNCTCEALANSIYNNFVNNKLGGSVDININGFIGTCTDNFYYLDNCATIISDLQNIEITNLDDTNTKTAIDIESAHKLKSIKNCTINNFYRGIYTPIYNIVNSETNKEEFVIYDNITINNCVQGINIGEYGCPWAHISNCTIIGKDTNLTNNSSYGIRYKTSPGEGWNPSALITAIEENNLDDIYSVTNCNISKVYNGIDLNALNGGIIRNCNITNIINGIDSGSVDRLCILDCVFTSADTEIHNYGLGQFNGGWAAIDCDFTGFYTGINHTIGGTGNIIGCTFTNNKKYGLYSYCDYVEDCVFTGNTETFIMTTNASGFKDIQITGNGTVNEETGKSNRNGTNIGISLGTANCIFEDDSNNLPSLMGSLNGCSLTTYKYDYYKLSDRNLTNDKTIITNCKTGVLGSGGTNYIVNIEISNCDIGCDDATSNQYKLGNIHINDCNKGIVSSDFRCGAYKENDNQVMLIENCDIGAEISNYSTENYYSGENYTIHFKSNDIGLKQTGTWVNHNALFFDSNRIGADLTNSSHPGTIPSIKLKDNTEVGIKLNNSTKSSTYFQITNGSKLLVDEDGSEPISLWLNTAIMMNSDVTYTGQGKIYLDNEYSYLYKYGTYVPENMPGTIEFDVKDALYKNGTIVATSGTTDYEWVNQLSAKKNGWIVTIVPPALWSAKKNFETPLNNWTTSRDGNMGFELSEGCTVTYDYATNGGTSVSGVPIGNSNYIDGGSIFDIMYENNLFVDHYQLTADEEAKNGKTYYILNEGNYEICDFNEAKANSETIYEFIHYTDEIFADMRASYVNDTTSYPVARNASTTKYNYKKGKAIDLVTPVAVKDGYTFVGWNTNPDATVGLTELTADQTNITLYAIYKKDITVTYHTYDTNKDYSDTVSFYNNEETKNYTLLTYPIGAVSTDYTFVGYVLDENETDLVNNILAVSSTQTISAENLDIYCVYSKSGTLNYIDVDNSGISSDTSTIKGITTSIIDMLFKYILDNHIAPNGYIFDGWSDGVSEHPLLQPGAEYQIADSTATLKAVESEIVVTSINVTPAVAHKYPGQTQQFTAEVLPATALNKDIVWASSNEDIATIDENGLATAVSVGTVTITATNTNSGVSGTATFVVDPVLATQVNVTPKESTIKIGRTVQLSAEVIPDETTDKSITWATEDPDIATVSNNGLVTGVSVGDITITATNAPSNKSDTATIHVVEASTNAPTINVSDTYKVTITAGTIQYDTLDKIYYRINEGDWTEYTGQFPVYKEFKVEAYQTTVEDELESDIVEVTGKEYATGIDATYIGDDKFLDEVVTKPEVKVVVHYPNSADEETTDFTLTDATIENIGDNTVTVTYKEYPNDDNSPNLTDTIVVQGKEATSQAPTITISDDYKVTLTAGTVTDDTVDKIYYKVNDGDWTEYTGQFPVYKEFTVEAYQTTTNRHIESEHATESGKEYANGITATYNGDDKFINEAVVKNEVTVIVHYPNSDDEETTNFTLSNTTITTVGDNIVNVSYKEYANDENSPTLTDTVTVTGKEALVNMPLITISNTYKVTLTAGAITDDELDKIYYRINEGDWQVYNGQFPVYKQFKVEAYQTTKNRHLESEINMRQGKEYASSITAEYLGDDKWIGEDVTKDEVKVTVHYPNSPDEETTDYTLSGSVANVGNNTFTATYIEYANDNECPELTDTFDVIGKKALTEKPTITVGNDFKATITAGEITNDTLDKIYYRVNGGTWTEYTGQFQVYKKYKIEAYQTTVTKELESEIAVKEGVEYATSISAEYLGDTKWVNDTVSKDELVVTLHYPVSEDVVITDYTLVNNTITKVGTNTLTIKYVEYPNDDNCPELTTTVEVLGKEATTEKPIITVNDKCMATIEAGSITNDTLDKIYYRVNDGEWTEYTTSFPVYKKYKIEAYQTTTTRHIESTKAIKEGTEYATGITAEYIGDDKYLDEEVYKREVIVTVHYPNSEDETTTDFDLEDEIITKIGTNEVIVIYKEYPDDENSPKLTTTVEVIGKKASTDVPAIKVNKTYKVTITAGEVENDEVKAIYYRVNGGDWTEYTEQFPVYKQYKVEAYQVTKRDITSDTVEKDGIEFADSISAIYLGEAKDIGEKVVNKEVEVTVHYPNSPDEITTKFLLPDPEVKKSGTNEMDVEYNEYPTLAGSPTLKTTVDVPGNYPVPPVVEMRKVTIKGTLKYSDGTPIANKTIVLGSFETAEAPKVNASPNSNINNTEIVEESKVLGAVEYKTTTNAKGEYIFNGIYEGTYNLALYDGTNKLGECKVVVAAPKKDDKVDIVDKDDNVTIDFSMDGDIIDISALLKIDNPTTEPKPTTPTTQTPPTTTVVKTNDIINIFLLWALTGISFALIMLLRKKKNKR